MFDISWSELLLIGAISAIVIGPENMPKALYTVGTIVRKVRTFTENVQKSLDKVMEEAELSEDIREAGKPDVQSLRQAIEIPKVQHDDREIVQIVRDG